MMCQIKNNLTVLSYVMGGSDMIAEKYSKMRQIIIKNMHYILIVVDELCRWCHVSARDGQAILLELELGGGSLGHAGNPVSRIYQDS